MTTRTITAAAALAAAVAVSAAIHRYRSLHRVLARERVQHRLMDGCLHRDMDQLRTRITAAVAREQDARAVLGEAGRVLDDALALHRREPHDPYDPYQEGDAA